MRFSLDSKSSIANIVIEEGNAIITEDVAVYEKGKGFRIPEEQIEQVIGLATSMYYFNDVSDIDQAEKIIRKIVHKDDLEELFARFRSEDEEG